MSSAESLAITVSIAKFPYVFVVFWIKHASSYWDAVNTHLASWKAGTISFYSFMVLGFNFHLSFLDSVLFPLDVQMSGIHFVAWSRWGSQPSKQRTKLKPFGKLLKSSACCKWIFKSNHTWGSFLAIASLSILSGMYVHVRFHLYFCLKIFESCLLKYIQRKCWHSTLPPSRQQKLQHAGNLTEKKPDTCADLWFLVSLVFANVTFPDSDEYCAFLHTDCGVRGFVNNQSFYLLSLLSNRIGWSVGWHEILTNNFWLKPGVSAPHVYTQNFQVYSVKNPRHESLFIL